ncbi:MAG: penicillin acylase family protein [Candidatus Pseudobacter hemicellulosilyticus]|uniref:Penicillin acylase family protein n=1 Tax=Candidatus Pseudobacter hemicellulosilyticus TaxID=3121375 RepID=A0AAJ5WSA4_9BACT|nr:MAG: penicillin acylase family protein [Pseudobacter sp.]
MRIVPFLLSGVTTAALVVAMIIPWGPLPPLGKFLSPQQGFWQNAEPADQSLSLDLDFPQLREKVAVHFDERLVPHVFAQNEEDLYFVQGYLHARFRLWQMELQTHAAAGRLTEILGAGEDSAILRNDRGMRRLGMVHAAKRSLELMESDPTIKTVLDAYTAGVNAYIDRLQYTALPLEYRLLNYMPEPWTNLKCALFLKYMSYDLAGRDNDLEQTNIKSVFSKAEYLQLFPAQPDSLYPIVPGGTAFTGSVKATAPLNIDSLYFQWKDSVNVAAASKPDAHNGSNNWVVSGSRTQSGRPILCNDPHLGLNLPSLWYEMQLHTPDHNVYGVSFPGAPMIVIGFNDRIAWGVTNSSRDVKDYYTIRFRDGQQQEYWFNNEWKKAELKVETYRIKDYTEFRDTVPYTVFGPVLYDRSFAGSGRPSVDQPLAVRWKAHDPSNELRTFYQLNRAGGYGDYLDAIRHFSCPGQNFIFADKSDTIAIWQQGEYPAKWKYQGDFIMPGTDSSFMWPAWIPQAENPHAMQPQRGFLASANQLPADSSYPYYLGGDYDLYRGYAIDQALRHAQSVTPEDMQQLQTSNNNVLAEMLLPLLLHHIMAGNLNAEEKKYLDLISNWNRRNDAGEKGPAIFKVWLDKLQGDVWGDEFADVPAPYRLPEIYTLVEGLLRDSAYPFIDNKQTPHRETLGEVATSSFRKAIPVLAKADQQGQLEWGKYKNAGIRHLLRLAPLSRFGLITGGGPNIINAIDQFHGPSWRMVVHLSDKTEAYGIYPGGQSGNPGSRYYDSFVDDWAAGRYHPLLVMEQDDDSNKQVKYTMRFHK